MDKKKKEQVLSVMAARYFGYNLLKRVYLEEPTEDFLKIIRDDKVLDFFPGSDKQGTTKTGCKMVATFVGDAKIDKDLINDLVADYSHLFLVSHVKQKGGLADLKDKENAPPYESVYRTAKGLVFQKETMKVRRIYMRHGLKPKNFMKEPDDHIAFELDFMSHLGKKALESIEKGKIKRAKEDIAAQEQFLNEHLLKWVPRFSTQMTKGAQTNFFKGFAKILNGFTKWDGKQVANVLEALGGKEEPAPKDRVNAKKPTAKKKVARKTKK